MVLEGFGKNIEERELRRLCNTTELGTFADDIVSCATELGFSAEKTYLVIDDLKKLTEEDVFSIVYVNTYSLNGIFATHAIIVEKIEDGKVLIIDPVDGRKTVLLEIFNKIWGGCSNLTIIIKRKRGESDDNEEYE